MLTNFFKLNGRVESFDKANFLAHLRTSKHICNMRYEPGNLVKQKISGFKFENVSFSKTYINRVTFFDCAFKDCLFIGTTFRSVDFHDCTFQDCNFYKAKFDSVYAKPRQFRKAITDDSYSNIAVHLYHELRENYYKESQREFKNEAEYFFGYWKRKNDYRQSKRKEQKWYQYQLRHLSSWLYGYLLGYGYRLRNLVTSATVVLFLAVIANYVFTSYLFSIPTRPSLIKTVYFTITTMATLGASGYNPNTEIGYMFVVLNVVIGISVLSATISAIFKKVIR